MSEEQIDPDARVINLAPNSRVAQSNVTQLVWPHAVTVKLDVEPEALSRLAWLGFAIVWIGLAVSVAVFTVILALASAVEMVARAFA
jgi:hypothetical protein